MHAHPLHNPHASMRVHDTHSLTRSRLRRDRAANLCKLGEGGPPHVARAAVVAFNGMSGKTTEGDRRPQSILISGESGAGKTEACKLSLLALAELSGSSGKATEAALESSELLEAFVRGRSRSNRRGHLPRAAALRNHCTHWSAPKSRVSRGMRRRSTTTTPAALANGVQSTCVLPPLPRAAQRPNPRPATHADDPRMPQVDGPHHLEMRRDAV